MDKKLYFAFFGTPEVASETLEILKQADFSPSLIITSPDKPQGRNMLITPPPVKTWALQNNIPVMQPEKLTPSAFGTSPLPRERLGGDFDLFIVVAYGKILPEEILSVPRLGSINIHYSLLPKYRGASPVESAILHGDMETGVTIQHMVYQMDAGPIIAQEKTAILPDETAPELRTRLIAMGGQLLVKILPDFANEKTPAIPQDETKATFSKKIKKEDGLVDLVAEPPRVLYNKFRAYAHWPRTFYFKDGKRIIITDAALEDGKFVIKKVLPEGKKEVSWEDFNLRHGVD